MIILVNEDYTVVDGQHRLISAKETGEQYVLVCIIKFNTKNIEADYFSQFDSFRTTLGIKDLVYAKYIAGGDSLANIIYKLNESNSSLLLNKIATKGSSLKYKYTISDLVRIINYIVFNTPQHFEFSKAKILKEKLSKVKYEEIEDLINGFISFINNTWGEWTSSSNSKPAHFRSNPFNAILRFYIEARKIGAFNTAKSCNSVVNKMSQFNEFQQNINSRVDYITSLLVTTYNHKRAKKSRISFTYTVN